MLKVLTKPKAFIKNNYVKIPQDQASQSTVSIFLAFSKAVCWALQQGRVQPFFFYVHSSKGPGVWFKRMVSKAKK